MIKLYDKYIKDVKSGKANVCKYVQQAVDRQLSDLQREKSADFPYYFDKTEAARWLGFVSILRHTSGEWKGLNFRINIQP